MEKTRTISFLVAYPQQEKSILRLLGEIRHKIKEVKENDQHLKEMLLADVGLCRLEGRVMVTLYFQQTEQEEPSVETVAGISKK